MSIAPLPFVPASAASTRPSSSDIGEEKQPRSRAACALPAILPQASDDDQQLLAVGPLVTVTSPTQQQSPLRSGSSPHHAHHGSLVSSTGSSPPSSETRGQLPGQRINLQKLSVGLNADPLKPLCVCNNLNECTVDLVERSVVELDLSVFLREFAYNCLFPLSTPFVVWREGLKGARNRGFWGLSPACVIQLIMAAGFAFLNYAYFGRPGSQIFFIEILALDAMLILRCAVIGCKYAYFPPSLLADLRVMDASMKQQRAQIITGWQDPTPATIQQELSFAVSRNMIDLTESYLYFDDADAAQLRFKPAMEDEYLKMHPQYNDWVSDMTDGRVHTRVVLTQIMLDSVRAISAAARDHWVQKILVVLSLLQACIGAFVRVGTGRFFFGADVTDYVAITMLVGVMFFQFRSNMQFLLVGIMDFKRRLFVFNDFSDMLTDRMRNFKLQKDVLPTIDWGCPNNMGQWHQARVIAKDYGKQYFYRIQAYASMFLFALIFMIGFLFYQLFSGKAETATVTVVIFYLAILMGVFIYMIWLGQQINGAALEHRFILLKKQNALQVTLAEGQMLHMKKGERRAPKGSNVVFNTTIAIITGIVKLMEVDAEENPLSILGFSATSNFARVLLTIGVTGLGIAVRMLT